jgi:tRNA-dihydrouridine synthase
MSAMESNSQNIVPGRISIAPMMDWTESCFFSVDCKDKRAKNVQ